MTSSVMKTGLRTFGMILPALIGAFVLWEGFVTVDYEAVCTRCLQQVHGVDKYFLGIHYFHEEKLAGENGEVSDPPRPPRPSPTSPDTYEQIFGTPCEHHYVRMGVGREQGLSSSEGRSPRPIGTEMRLALIRKLFQTFHRVPDRDLARQSYALIDQFYPEKPPARASEPLLLQREFEVDAFPNEPMSILYRGLTLLQSPDDWRAVLGAAKAHNGSLALISNVDVLEERLKDADPAVKKQAVNSLAELDTPAAWAAIVTELNDPEAGGDAARQIVWNKHFEYFDRVLFIWDRPYGHGANPQDLDDLGRLKQTLTDAYIRTLFSQSKPIVDNLCFEAIEATDRFKCLGDVLTVINKRPSPEGEHAIRYLIAGPYPYGFRNEETGQPQADPWAEAYSYYSSNSPNIRFYSNPSGDAMRTAIKLSDSTGPQTWESWQSLFSKGWAEIPGNGEMALTGIALRMNAADPKKTLAYLDTCLEGTVDDSGPRPATAILLAMGYIARPDFLPSIEKFKARSKNTNYAKYPFYGQYVDFAEHRCRHIQDWKLVADPTGAEKYVIVLNDGSTMR